jgi:hypothetical protein
MRTAIALCLFIPIALWADKKTPEDSLVRIADLNVPAASSGLGPAFVPVGTDPLGEGSLQVGEDGRVEVELDGAMATQAYSVLFCRFGFPPANCLAIGPAGGLATNATGDGRATLNFPSVPLPNAWAGAFVLTRTIGGQVTYEYVTGFRLRSPTAGTNAADINIEGLIASINTANRSFRIGSLPEIVTDNNTEFEGRLRQFSDLTTGLRVKVKAQQLNDGRLWAREVEAEGGPSRGRGKGKKKD